MERISADAERISPFGEILHSCAAPLRTNLIFSNLLLMFLDRYLFRCYALLPFVKRPPKMIRLMYSLLPYMEVVQRLIELLFVICFY